MSAAVLTFVLLGVLLFSPVSPQNESILQKLLSAVEKLVEYYQKTYKYMNLDGIFGLRALEGQLSLILSDIASRHIHSIDQEVAHKLERLHHVSASVSNMSLTFLREQDEDYYRRMQLLVDKPFRFAKPYRQIKPHLMWRESDLKKGDGGFDEDFSDRCMTELMGSDGHARCEISEECLHTMSAPGYGDYGITHQLLYTILAEQCGCLSVLDQMLKVGGYIGGVEALQEELCTNNFFEMAEVVQGLKGNLIPRTQDLFMEQELVCPMLGYMDFLHEDWLNQIISWQRPNGCYGKMQKSDLARFSNTGYQYQGESQGSDQNQGDQNQNDEIDFVDKAIENGVDQMNQQPQHIELRHYQQLTTEVTVKQGKSGVENHNNVIQNRVNQRKMNHNIEQSNVVIQQPNGNLHAIVGNNSGIVTPGQVPGPLQQVDKVRNKVSLNDKNLELSNNKLQFKPNSNQQYKQAVQNSPEVVQQNKLQKSNKWRDTLQTENKNGDLPDLENSRNKVVNRKGLSDNIMPNRDGGMPGQRDVGGKPAGNQAWWESRLQRPSPQTGQEGTLVGRQQGQPVPGQDSIPVNQEGSPVRQGRVLSKGMRGVAPPAPALPQGRHNEGAGVRAQPDHLQPVNRQGRKLLFEKHLQDGCLSHKTAVAAGALSQYLKFVLDPGPPEFQAVVQMTGTNFLMVAKHRFAAELPDIQHQQAGNVNNEEIGFQENENHVLKRPNIPDDQNIDEPGNQELGDTRDKVVRENVHNHKDEKDYVDNQENPPQDYYKDQININKEEDKLDRKASNSKDKIYSDREKADYVDDEYEEQDKKDKHRKELHEAGLDAGDKEYEQYIDNDENGFNQNKAEEVGQNGNGEIEEHQYVEDTEETDDRAANVKPLFTTAKQGSNTAVVKSHQAEKEGISDDAYSYYDNGHERIRPAQNKDGDDLIDDLEDGGGVEESVMKQTHKFDLTTSIGKTYILLLLAMLVLLFFMYRFIRRRRVLIRYRYR